MEKQRYFTDMNNRLIYGRLENELGLGILEQPVLEAWDYGYQNVCLAEKEDSYRFYIVDKTEKYEYAEFNRIEDAIERLVNYYKEKSYNDLDNDEVNYKTNKMREIFYQILGLEQNSYDCDRVVKVLK